MIGKIAGAVIGKKVAERYGSGTRGMVAGALVPIVMRRAFGPLGLVLAGGYAAKKLYDAQKGRRGPASGQRYTD
jgi:hypothetical protein